MKNRYRLSNVGLLALFLLGSGCHERSVDRIGIDGKSVGDEVPASLYGVFFEEISHSGDGGIYAEMIQNRGFEEGVLPSGTELKDGYACASLLHCYSNDSINGFKVKWDEGKSMNAWELVSQDGQDVSYDITAAYPLHAATPHALHVNLGAGKTPLSIVNHGYWGIAVESGQQYLLKFWMKSSPAVSPSLTVSLKNKNGDEACRADVELKNDNKWNCYEVSLTAVKGRNDYSLYIDLENRGDIYLDYVSLFPKETYKGRENGLRKDIASYLAELKPAFIRWPGGCIVEGLTMDNRVKWKETIGDPMKRPGEYNLWGYRSTYGFGYHEFLQYCEDIHSDAMFVCNAGMSCLFRNGDYVEGKELDALVQDALDAIEYAIGGVDTRWGAERARNGHPNPFPLKYVEVGNENVGLRYAEHYKKFYKAIKEKYPQMTVVCALMFHPEVAEAGTVEVIDPHYYETADWFYRNSNLYDSIPSLYRSKIYIGEYAATGNPSVYSSLAEAAFLTGVERNGSRVQYVSYAPLFQNANNGTGHLIIFKNDSVYGRSNYHVLKMFAENRPDYNLGTKIDFAETPRPVSPVGLVGLGSCGSSVSYKDFKIERDGKVVYQADDFSGFAQDWKVSGGEWSVSEGILTQSRLDGDGYVWLDGRQMGNCVISLKAMKHKGREAFRIFFGAQDENNYYMADLGSHQNESVIFGERKNGVNTSLFDYRNTTNIRTGEWYDIKVEIKDNHWKCYLNGELAYEYTYAPLVRHYAVSGYDVANRELVIKLVNGENEEWASQISLSNVSNIASEAKKIVLAGDAPDAENSFSNPEKVIPVEGTVNGISETFGLTCPANSFTVLRIPCDLNK